MVRFSIDKDFANGINYYDLDKYLLFSTLKWIGIESVIIYINEKKYIYRCIDRKMDKYFIDTKSNIFQTKGIAFSSNYLF